MFRIAKGHRFEYTYAYLPSNGRDGLDEKAMSRGLQKMEKEGWEVLNFTGTRGGHDVVWFRRKRSMPKGEGEEKA